MGISFSRISDDVLYFCKRSQGVSQGEFFGDVESAMRRSTEDEKLMMNGPIEIAVPFLSQFCSFVTTADEVTVVVEDRGSARSMESVVFRVLLQRYSSRVR